MKRLLVAITLTALPSLGLFGVARADGFLDTVKNLAAKPEVQSAAKTGAGKAVDMVRGKPSSSGTPAAGTTAGASTSAGAGAGAADINGINGKLLDASTKNPCTFKTGSDKPSPETACDTPLAAITNAIMNARFELMRGRASGYKFEIVVYPEAKGNAATNKVLAEKRAAFIVGKLTARGLPAAEFASTSSPAPANAANRRYEVRIKI